jgi:hypothetical protein
MFGSQILDVVIGMIFVFLLLSLICSALNEIIEAKLKNRAKNLELGIRTILGNDKLAAEFWDHGLINGLFKNGEKPSYIPSRTFALALMNTVAPPAGDPGANPLQVFREAILKTKKSETSDELVPQVPDKIREALLTLVDDAQGDIDKLRTNIENWYDDSMDRVSGWYKRRVHKIIVLLGLGLAIAMNADSAYIARSLANDAALRSSLVSAAQAFAQNEKPADQKPPSQPGAAIPATAGATNTQASAEPGSVQFQDNLDRIKKLGLPMGWNNETSDPHLKWPGLKLWQPGVPAAWAAQIRFHWLGWILTALAISLGAPFWFDLLSKFITIRSTMKPEKKDEPAKS